MVAYRRRKVRGLNTSDSRKHVPIWEKPARSTSTLDSDARRPTERSRAEGHVRSVSGSSATSSRKLSRLPRQQLVSILTWVLGTAGLVGLIPLISDLTLRALLPLPGRCFRLVVNAGEAGPMHCPAPVAWRGSRRAPNGRRYRVEACEDHRSALG